MKQLARQTLLEYYREHQITPVRYDLSSIDAHLERRSSLYTKLGLSPLSFRQSKVLEVAAGTGHNSLYLAQCMPSKLVLLEPNLSGVEHIHEVYKTFSKPHTPPEIICQTLEEYQSIDLFDIVLCENWIGTPEHEQLLLQKLAGLVAAQGMLVLTSVSPIGITPNLLRRFLSVYLAPITNGFQQRTEILVSAFASHLDTLSAMTRNKTDWVQDNMINPVYFTLCLTMPDLLQSLGDRFDIIGTSPVFSEDWRWFKSMHGSERKFNEQFLSEYWKKSHNFLDYREQPITGFSASNITLEKKSLVLLKDIAAHENAHINKKDTTPYVQSVLNSLDDFILSVPTHFASAIRGLGEVRNLMCSPASIGIASVANMLDFSALFGRETSYVSLLRAER